ncbi:uncharacterized protein RSE6_12670 [Rhynchosporium secalis]|uniref:Uncharacterized protein n=1 Tax=Rhynchosporium secalis TaxID=38038 RepID=A0A1E1MQZ5_RHYSE|nr:uncharacterized protein RSE6_12670 [Rhynchosporium secalis]
MEPFPPFKTAADSRAELHFIISTRLGLIEAFTTSPACSDEDFEKIEHFLGIIESTVLTKVEKEIDDDRYTAPAARVSDMHPYPRIPSAYASGALLIPSTDPESPVSPKTINYIPRIFSNNYALTAGSSKDIANVKDHHRDLALESMPERENRDGKSQDRVSRPGKGVLATSFGRPGDLRRRRKLAARKLAIDERAAVGMLGNMSIKGHGSGKMDEEGATAAGGMDMS